MQSADHGAHDLSVSQRKETVLHRLDAVGERKQLLDLAAGKQERAHQAGAGIRCGFQL